ncbi:MAG TPA: RNA methyltransferase [Isosphaeraceae bacterium]|jgi:TrmH family RNA methyltransferase|nr:RNA methyltransferase [Isosphaeraceae bacterium]
MADETESVRRTDPEAILDEVERLQSDRPHRDARRAFFAEGVRNLVEADANGFDVRAIVVSERLLTSSIARKRVRDRRGAGVPTIAVGPEDFRRVSRAPRASGVGAILGQRWDRLHSASPRAGLCWVVLEDVRSLGNLGTLIRTSEAVGGAGFILVGGRVDPYDPAVVRATMGGLFRQRFIRTTAGSLRHWLRRHGCHAVGASPEGPAEFHRVDYPRPTVLLLGEEGRGLSPSQRGLCPQLVRIPMVGAADSLNVAVAGSLLLYEVYRSHAAGRARRPGRTRGDFPRGKRGRRG